MEELTHFILHPRICYPNGSSTVYSYEAGGRVKSVRYPDGNGEAYRYDAKGNLMERKTTAGERYLFSYDCLDRIISITNPSGGTRSFAYDALGRITKAIDENQNETYYSYSPNGNLIQVKDALGNETDYKYDKMGHLIETSSTGVNGEEAQNTIYTWDKEGHVTAVTDPLGDVERYTYTPAGKLSAKVDKDGYETKYDYEISGQIKEILYADGRKVSLSYNALRQLEEVKDWIGTTTVKMDEVGRISSITDPYGKTVGYEWGRMGERKAVLYPDGKKATYEYNDAMQLVAMQTGNGKISYSYDEVGRLIGKQMPGGASTSYAYNEAGRLEEILHLGADFRESYHYEYDQNGNKILAQKDRQGVAEDSGNYAYDYDALNRLIGVSLNGELLRTYGYDAFGNRSRKTEYTKTGESVTTYQYNAKNQLLAQTDGNGTKNYSYDHRGNLLQVTRGEELLQAYGFDAANQMHSSMGVVDGVIKNATYQYNGLGHRMEQTLDAEVNHPKRTIRYTLDLTRQYHNLLQKSDNEAEQTYFWDGNVTGMETNGEEHFYFQDDLGSPMRLSDESGRSEAIYGYDEYGQNIRTREDIFKNPMQAFGFTGYQMDEAGGLYFAQARRYDAGLGRFISEDIMKGHIAVPFTMNHYNYCWNRPLDLVDLNGMWPSLSDIGKGIKDAVSSAVDTVSDVVDKAVDTVKETASNIADSVVDFCEEHREAIQMIGTVAAIAGVAALSVATGGVAGAILAGAAVGASVGGVVGGVSNVMTGGSFSNGFVGGAVNGAIVGAATAIPGAGPLTGYIANAAGGFTGNLITEELNNLDGAGKSQTEILATSAFVGAGQMLVGGGCNHLGIANNITSGMSNYIWQGFSNLIGFSAGTSIYVLSDFATRENESATDDKE